MVKWINVFRWYHTFSLCIAFRIFSSSRVGRAVGMRKCFLDDGIATIYIDITHNLSHPLFTISRTVVSVSQKMTQLPQ